MNKKDKANAYKRLLADDTFKLVLDEVREGQVGIFLNPNSDGEEREKAHNIVIALQSVIDYMDGVIASDIIDDKKKY